jgi:hypothetical protein
VRKRNCSSVASRRSRRTWRRGLLGALVASGTFGCRFGDADPAEPAPADCPGKERQSLIGGSTDEIFLGIGASSQRAIVPLVDGSGATDALCSGTFISPTWVMSAAHCLAIPELAVRVRGDASSTPNTLALRRSELHPSLDLALLEVDFGSLTDVGDVLDLGATPIPVAATEPSLKPGDAVELAGYGTTETTTFGELRFLVEMLIEIDDDSLRVDGFGRTGACTGDSGGPMLTRSAAGEVVVLGVLSAGAATCTNQDRFVRAASALDWIESITGPAGSSEPDCHGIDAEGRCFHGAAIWCDDGLLDTATCAETGRRCGWDDTALGFRCVDSASDPCRGVDGVGACVAGRALTCTAGALLAETCGPCGDCFVDGRAGAPYCASASP